MIAETHRLTALCFADIAGYTELSATDESEAIALVRLFQEVAREVVQRQGGRIVKFIGDAVLAEFTSTSAATRAALDLRDRFVAEARTRSMGPRSVRVGVHVGEIVTSPDGDLYGDGVNVASRIHAAAPPGQVWVSEDVWRQLRQRREFGFDSRGDHLLKGIAAPVALYAVASTSPASADRDSAAGFVPQAKPPAGSGKRSVAVLPFADMSPGADHEYFADGVTEEILALLARIEGLKVISRTSVMRYKKSDKPMRQIAEELGVATILEGSVRQAGQRVRITAQLIDAARDEHLWAERYDRDLEDIFAIQTDVAERIVEALEVRLKPREKARLAERPTENLEAYQAYLKGRHFLSRRTEATLRQAIEWFRKAVESDPAFAHAWVGLAEAYAILPEYSVTTAHEATAEARAAAGRALAIDPGLGEAHATLGQVERTEWRWDEAEREFHRALELSPGYATTYHWYGLLLMYRCRLEEALGALASALELDPLALPIHTARGAVLDYARKHDQAIEIYHKVLAMDPVYVFAHLNLANAYIYQRRYGNALDEWETVAQLVPESYPPELVAEVREGYRSGGERGFWEAYLEGLRSSPKVWAREFDMGTACAQLGKIDEAFTLIDQMLSERRPYAYQIPLDPMLDPLRCDPRWEKVLERLGLR